MADRTQGVIEELQAIQNVPEWGSVVPTSRLEWLNQYEQKLFDKAQAKYPGGWDKFVEENPEASQFLEETKKQQFAESQTEISNKANSFVRSTLNSGTESVAESFFRHTAAGANYSAGTIAHMFGYGDKAAEWEKNGDLVRTKWRVGVNELANRINTADEKMPVANELYAFAQGFLPFLQVDSEAGGIA
jgi:hypothetical protein